MGKKKSRSKHKNPIKAELLTDGEVQESSSSIKEANDQLCDSNVQEEIVACKPKCQEMDSEQCRETHNDTSALTNGTSTIENHSEEIISKEINGLDVPPQPPSPSGPVTMEQNHSSVNCETLDSTSAEKVENGVDVKTNEELVHHDETEKINASGPSAAEGELLQNNPKISFREQNAVNTPESVLEVASIQKVGVHSSALEERKPISDDNNSSPQTLSIFTEDPLIILPIKTEVNGALQSEGRSENPLENSSRGSSSISTLSSCDLTMDESDKLTTAKEDPHLLSSISDTPSNTLTTPKNDLNTSRVSHGTEENKKNEISKNAPELENVISSTPAELIPMDDKKDIVNSILREIQGDPVPTEKLPECEVFPELEDKANLKELIHNDASQSAQKNSAADSQKQQEKTEITIADKAENIHEISSSPSESQRERVNTSNRQDFKVEGHKKKKKNKQASMSRNKEAEAISGPVFQLDVKEQAKEKHGDFSGNTNNIERNVTTERQTSQIKEMKIQEEKNNSKLTTPKSSEAEVESTTQAGEQGDLAASTRPSVPHQGTNFPGEGNKNCEKHSDVREQSKEENSDLEGTAKNIERNVTTERQTSQIKEMKSQNEKTNAKLTAPNSSDVEVGATTQAGEQGEIATSLQQPSVPDEGKNFPGEGNKNCEKHSDVGEQLKEGNRDLAATTKNIERIVTIEKPASQIHKLRSQDEKNNIKLTASKSSDVEVGATAQAGEQDDLAISMQPPSVPDEGTNFPGEGNEICHRHSDIGEQLNEENGDLAATTQNIERIETIEKPASQINQLGSHIEKNNIKLTASKSSDAEDKSTTQDGEKNDLAISIQPSLPHQGTNCPREGDVGQQLKEVNVDLATTMSIQRAETIERQAIKMNETSSHSEKNNTKLMAPISSDAVAEATTQAGDQGDLATSMMPSGPDEGKQFPRDDSKSCEKQKKKNNNQSKKKMASRSETRVIEPDSSATNNDQHNNLAETQKAKPEKCIDISPETIKEKVPDKQKETIPVNSNPVTDGHIINESSKADISTSRDINEITQTEFVQSKEDTRLATEMKPPTPPGSKDQSTTIDPSARGATGKNRDKNKRKVEVNKTKVLPNAADKKTASVPEYDQPLANKSENCASQKGEDKLKATVKGPKELIISDETFQARPIFMANTCHVCKSVHGGETRLKSCSACRLIAYCSKEHQRKHWKDHKALCQQVQKRIKEKGLQDLYGDAYKITDAEEWRKYRCFQIFDMEKHMDRPLLPFEREMFLYPRVCSVCHKSDPEKLKVCKGCHFINYCSNEHLPISHKVWCKDLKLILNLNQYQSRYGLIRPHIPSINLDNAKHFPKSLKDLFTVSLSNEQNTVHFDLYEAVLSDIATCPLTICYVLNLMGVKKQAEITKKLTVHLVGAENQFEVEPLSKWDSFLLNLLPHITKLHLVFIGPELEPANIDELNDSNYQMLELKTINSCKKLTAEFYYGQLYHDYTMSPSFTRPDIICAFNCGIYRLTGFNNKDTWGPTIVSMVKDSNIPILLTAYTEVEAPMDVARFKKQCKVKELVPPTKNPFASMRPNLNFVSDDETPLIYKNQYLSVIAGCD